MSLDRRFFDDFDNNSVDLQTAGVGTFTEPVGTSLVISNPAGTHAGWWNGAGNDNEGAPVGYEDLDTYLNGRRGLVRIECRYTNLTRTGNEVLAGLVAWRDRDNAYWIGWYPGDSRMYVQRVLADAAVSLANPGYYGEPSTSAHIYRIYINLDSKPRALADQGQILQPGEIGFAFSTNDGASWAWAYKETMAFVPLHFGLMVRNWSTTWRGYDASFDYLKLEQDLEEGEFEVDGQTEIAAAPVSMGEDNYQDGIGRGTRREDVGGQLEVVTQSLDTGGVSEDGGSRGQFFPESTGLMEVDPIGQVIEADFLIEKQDGDGNDILSSEDVKGILPIDATQGSFGSPVANNHWGAAADGQFYADGLICGPGDFGTVLGGFRTSAWRFSGQDPLGLADNTTIFNMVADDQIRIQGVWAAWANAGGDISSHYKWYLTGDFDIQVDFLNYVVSAGSEGESRLAVLTNSPSGLQQFYINRDANGTYRTARILNGGYASLGTTATADTSGKLRITRVSGVLTAYKWNGVGWDQVGATYNDASLSGALYVGMGSSGNNNTNTDITFSNFTINSGTTTNRAGWYREASGANRGTQQSMPNSLVAICLLSEVSLVDPVNGKLWMRFVRSGNNALHYYSSYGQRPWRAKWSNGLLMIAHGSETTQNPEGGAIWVDFTRDQIRIHRETISTVCGGYYANCRRDTTGGIARRNDNYSYTEDHDEWGIQDYRVYDVDILHAGNFEYRAVCTHDGIRMFKLKRWYPLDPLGLENSSGPESTRMVWCLLDQVDGELFYMDTANMYSRDKTGGGQGWEDWMTGGTWAAQTTKALPGTRVLDTQFHAARLDPYIFIPAVEGVYRVDWPSGSWELFFGDVGSGATHEILPDYKLVHALAVGNDGVSDLLLVSVEKDQKGQTLAIRLSDNTIYGQTRLADLKIASVVVT